MHRRRMAAAAAVVTALGLVGTGCTKEEGTGPAASPPDHSTPAEEVWRAPLDVVGQPLVADGVALVYATKGEELAIHAFDTATGKELWTAPASPGGVVTGIAVQPALVERGKQTWVAYLRPPDYSMFSNSADLLVARLRTGQVVAQQNGLVFTSTPSACEDGNDVCVNSRLDWFSPTGEYRLDILERAYHPEPGAPSNARPIGSNGLVGLIGRDPEKLARVVDGKVAWRLRLDRAFPKGSSTDYGWNFTYREEEDLFVGSVGGGITRNGRGEITASRLSKSGVAGIDAATGKVRWRARGSLCLDDRIGDDHETGNVRCRDTGIGRVSPGSQRYRWSKLHATVEGFDPRTGKATWSLDVGPGKKRPFEGREVVYAGPGTVAVRTHDGPVVLDLQDGSRRAPVEGEVFTCLKEKTFAYEEGYSFSDRVEFERRGTGVVAPCDARGKAVDAPLGHHAMRAVAKKSGDVRLVSLEGALVAYAAEPS